MNILPEYFKADVPHEPLEQLIYNYLLISDVEADLQAGGHADLYEAFLKLQQDSGVQIDVAKILNGTNFVLGGTPETPEYGIHDDAPPPGGEDSMTARLYAAYQAVTYERLQSLLPSVHARLSGETIRAAFQYAAQEVGVVWAPARSPVADSPSPGMR